ncbi:MAG: hypothetical protein MUC96_18460, partial [Myxococcaceae bacterium]|nr:hypothetical protein [Myxococcaceae bacterium]
FRSRMTARRVRWSIAMHGEDHITGSAATGFRGSVDCGKRLRRSEEHCPDSKNNEKSAGLL